MSNYRIFSKFFNPKCALSSLTLLQPFNLQPSVEMLYSSFYVPWFGWNHVIPMTNWVEFMPYSAPHHQGAFKFCWVRSCPSASNTDSRSYECNWMALGEIVWFPCCFPAAACRVYPTFLSTLTENIPIKSERKSVEPCEWIRSSICDSILVGMLLFLHGKRRP